jgi:hypothetical protein
MTFGGIITKLHNCFDLLAFMVDGSMLMPKKPNQQLIYASQYYMRHHTKFTEIIYG